jgi:predicted NUDIX family phosphoesterase
LELAALTEEHVLVIPAERLQLLGNFTGFAPFDRASFEAILDPQHMQFRPRSQVEEDPTFKQLIPYCILQHGSRADGRFFQYTRGSGQGEKRLHAKRSIGIGGHISREDATGADLYRSGMERELSEEMIIDGKYTEQLFGFIYDDTTPVGRVHLGVVHLLTLENTDARARESEMMDSGFVSLADLAASRDHFETWSQLCIQQLSQSVQ